MTPLSDRSLDMVLERAYRALMLVYPRDFRRRVGTDMAEVFADLCRHEHRTRGAWGLMALTGRTLRDVTRNGLAERFKRAGGSVAPQPEATPSRLPRDSRTPKGDPMGAIAKDVSYALRTLRKQPLFSLTVIFVLALGVAGTTGIFSVFNGLFLRPLPFDAPDRLVNLDETAPEWNLEFVSINMADFVAWHDQNRSFEAMAVYDLESANMTLNGEPSRVDTTNVSAGIFDVLAIEPVIGRRYTAAEDEPGAEPVALLAYAQWQERFAGDPQVVGRPLTLDGEPHTIIGVLPPEAVFIGGDVWTPLQADPMQNTGSWWLNGIGRLLPGVTAEEARVDLERIHKGMIEERGVNEVTSPVVMPVLERLIGDMRAGTVAMLVGVGLVLLIACANVAGLMLARGTGRAREVGVRVALGAGRARILQQQLTESALLAAAGAVAGVALGYAGLRAALAVAPDNIPQWVSFDVDLRFLLFTLVISTSAALLFGFAPAWRAARTDPQRALQASGRSSSGSGRRWGLKGLVVSEVALALLLLICAGLLIGTVRELGQVDPGFRPESLLTYRVALPEASYAEDPQQRDFFVEHLAGVAALPGVVDAGAVTSAPLGGHSGYFFAAENAAPRAEEEANPVTLVRWATIDYFDAIGINLLAGRTFTTADFGEEAAEVAVVNETFADYHWPGGDAVGKRFASNADDEEPDWVTVVGVAQNVKHYGLDTPMRPGIYLPFERSPMGAMTIVARTAVEPTSLADEARALVRRRDPDLPIFAIATMEQALADSLWTRRAASWALALFAGVAVLLAVSGIYGVVSYAVGQRTHEIGIRMALGAQRATVLRQIVGEGSLLLVAGTVLGVIGAFAAARAVQSMLFGISPTEPVAYVAGTLLLAGVALLANLIPARRAAAIDPVEALRRD